MARPSAGIRATSPPRTRCARRRTSVVARSVNRPRCSTSPAATMSPVSNRRRASTGPSRWKKRCRLPRAGPSRRAPGHPEPGVATDHGEVGHQRQLEGTTERVRLDLRDRHLRTAQELVVEAEGLAIDAEAAALAGAALRVAGPVPVVRVVHVGAGAEDSAGAAEDHDLDVVVGRRPRRGTCPSAGASSGSHALCARGCRW